MSHIGPEMSSGAPLEEEHCGVVLVESRLRGSEGPVAADSRVQPAEALSLAVSAITVNAGVDEVKNSLTDCVDEVECSVIRVCLGEQGELQCEVGVAGSAGQVVRLSTPGTEPVLEEHDSVLEVRGFTLTTL